MIATLVIILLFSCIFLGIQQSSIKKNFGDIDAANKKCMAKISSLEEGLKYSHREIEKLKNCNEQMSKAMGEKGIHSYSKAAEMLFESHMAVQSPDIHGKKIIAAIERRTEN